MSRKTFDNFLPYLLIGAFGHEAGIPLENWKTLLKEWECEPSQTIATYNRGNCINFATYTQQALRLAGSETAIIGRVPPLYWSPERRTVAHYSHTSLLSHAPTPMLYEPGWRVGQPIPVLPEGEGVRIADWHFKTVDFTNHSFTQEVDTPNKRHLNRQFDLAPLSTEALRAMMKGVIRVPRNMEIMTLHKEKPFVSIRYEEQRDVLVSNIEDLPDPFTPEDITTRKNESLSDTLGFDLKEELLAVLAVRAALPGDFWVK